MYGTGRSTVDRVYLARVLFRLGELYENAKDVTRATEYSLHRFYNTAFGSTRLNHTLIRFPIPTAPLGLKSRVVCQEFSGCST
jgi:hypothetical protein